MLQKDLVGRHDKNMKKITNKKHIYLTFPLLGLLVLALAFVMSLRISDVQGLATKFVKVEYFPQTKGVQYTLVDEPTKDWVQLTDIAPYAANAIVISEDWAFYEHSGVDYAQLKEALKDHMEGQKLRGASTLSQQLVKNVFLSSERSYLRKAREFAMAQILEKTSSKEKILEAYLNIVEFGEGVYGIKQASKHYFNKPAHRLNAKEGAFLAMLLPSPKKHSTSFEEKKLTPYAEKTITQILEKMHQAKMINKNELNAELKRKLPFMKKAVVQKRPKKAQRNPNQLAKAKPKSEFDDGSAFERQYRVDADLELESVSSFDPSTLDSVDIDDDIEFSLE